MVPFDSRRRRPRPAGTGRRRNGGPPDLPPGPDGPRAVRAVAVAVGIGGGRARGGADAGVVDPSALVLNATFEPLGIVSSRRAVLLVLDTKAELVHATERVFRAARVTVPEPSVVRLVRYVKVPHNYRVAVNRRTVFAGTAASASTAAPRPRTSTT